MNSYLLKDTFDIIKSNPTLASFIGNINPDLISFAEQTLEIKFPPSYREFLGELGAGSFAGEEFYGITDSNFESSTIPNGIWLTLQFRQQKDFPHSFIVVYTYGEGTYCCIDTSRIDEHNESPIVAWVPGFSKAGDKLELISKNFKLFFSDLIQKGLSDWNS